jgi:hypothetical protein
VRSEFILEEESPKVLAMDGLSHDAIQILQYLLPGFLAAWIFYGLTPYDVPSQFERVIHALILTLVIQTFVFLEKWILDVASHPWMLSISDDSSHLIASTISAFVVGIVFAFCANHDTFHGVARFLKITQETSYSSEWFGAFCTNVTFVVLQLKDERRIYGWPQEWPSDSKEGHFLLVSPSWLLPDGAEEPMTGVSSILINTADVEWVEFMEKSWER